MSQTGLKHAATEPGQLTAKRERRRGASGRASVLRRAPSDSDCSGETASLSADSGDRKPPPTTTRSAKSRSRRRGSEWEVLEGLKDGQRFDKRPEVYNGYLHKKRKWPLKGWHKRFFVIDGGILVYARSPTDVARGRLHGSVDVGLSVISAKQRRRRIDIDADEFIYHLRAKTPDVFRTWLHVLKAHRLYRQHLLTFGARESVPKIHAPLDDVPAADSTSRTLSQSNILTSSSSFQDYPETPCEVTKSSFHKTTLATHTEDQNSNSYFEKSRIKNGELTPLERSYESPCRYEVNIKNSSEFNNLQEKQLTEGATALYCFTGKKNKKPETEEQVSIKKSNKSTNLHKYKNVTAEPTLKKPLSKCMLLKKYQLKTSKTVSTNTLPTIIQNVSTTCYANSSESQNKAIPIESNMTASEYDRITEKIMMSILGYDKTKEENHEKIKAKVAKIVAELEKVSDNPAKKLFKALLEYWLRHTSIRNLRNTIREVKSCRTFKDAQLSCVFKQSSLTTMQQNPTVILNRRVTERESDENGREIEELEMILKNTVYLCETEHKNRIEDIKTTKELIDALDDKGTVSSEIEQLQSAIRHLISETSIPAALAKEFLNAYLDYLNQTTYKKSSDFRPRDKKSRHLIKNKVSRSVTTITVKKNIDSGQLYLKNFLDTVTKIISETNRDSKLTIASNDLKIIASKITDRLVNTTDGVSNILKNKTEVNKPAYKWKKFSTWQPSFSYRNVYKNKSSTEFPFLDFGLTTKRVKYYRPYTSESYLNLHSSESCFGDPETSEFIDRDIEVNDHEPTCYVMSALNSSLNTKSYIKGNTVITEEYILALLENLTSISKNTPDLHKDIETLFKKFKGRYDQVGLLDKERLKKDELVQTNMETLSKCTNIKENTVDTASSIGYNLIPVQNKEINTIYDWKMDKNGDNENSESLKANKKSKDLKIYRLYFNNLTKSFSETNSAIKMEWNEKMKITHRCHSNPFCNGHVSPNTPPLRGPQAGFVSGTPGGRLASWIIESGGPLESASREIGQAQLSIQQLQRLLESLELQQQVHHDTDVSLEGASPNVKKDRRKFGLRKKKSNSKCASVELAPPHIDGSSSHMTLSALTAPPSPGGGASSGPNSAASLPIACAATRPQSLPGADSLAGAPGPASLSSLTPEQQLREDFVVLAKDLVGSLKTVVGTLVCERSRLRAAMDAAETTAPNNSSVVASLRTNLSSALQQNSVAVTELRSRLSRIHDASDLAELSSLGPNSDPQVGRQFQASLSYSSSCVSASEFFDAEEHDDDDLKQEEDIEVHEAGVIELDGDSSSEAGSLSSEEGSASSDNSDGALLTAEPVTLRHRHNGVDSQSPSGWSRRKCLPHPRPTPGGPSLWNLLYKNIGKDLSQISMPVTINEPLNMLQKLCEELEYSQLLDCAASCKEPIERMCIVAAFAVSAYASSTHRAASKPFNPLLAETYECVRDDRDFRFISEQVSHHPPISACHAESPRWVFWQEARIKTKFWGKSMEFQPTGRVHVRLLSTGDHYSWNKVTTCVHNLFGGQRWVDQYGDMHIMCHGTDITAKLNFIKASSWSASRHEVRGHVAGCGTRVRLQGRWSEALHAGDPPADRCLWRPGAMPPEHADYYGFTRFAMELNELEPHAAQLLPHTDTRFRPDQRALEQGDVEAAERWKHRLEEAQRERRRTESQHTPNWFHKAMEEGEETWVFTGDYWKAREAGFPDLNVPRLW